MEHTESICFFEKRVFSEKYAKTTYIVKNIYIVVLKVYQKDSLSKFVYRQKQRWVSQVIFD